MDFVPHPDAAALAAFVQGKLSGANSAAVEEHLLTCDVCVRALQDQPGDALLRLVRETMTFMDAASPGGPVPSSQAGPSTMFPLAGSVADTDAWQDPAQRRDTHPAPLADHGPYRVLRLLGQGGMGAVYVARHRVMRRLVAIKVIKPEFTADPAAVERFRREVRVVAQLQHPNLVTAHDANQAGDTHYLVMEYVNGVSLAQLLRERGPLPVAEACSCVRQAALGLQHAHERGLVHRDVKPDNLMRAADGTVKVLDFGLAALTAEREAEGLTSVHVAMGTPDYMAPEQAEDARQADTRADVYSLGCTLFHLLTGQVPYPATTRILRILAHREKPLPALRALRPEVPPALAAVMGRMLAKRPSDRYQTPGEVAAALAPFVEGATPSQPTHRRRRRLLVAVGLLGLLAALLTAALIYRMQTDGGDIVPQPKAVDAPPEALRRREPPSDPNTGVALYWGAVVREMSAKECLERAIALLGNREQFMLAETVDNAVCGHNEKVAVLIFPRPMGNGIGIHVLVSGQDATEVQQVRSRIEAQIADGPPPRDVPPWVGTQSPDRKSQAPVLQLGIGRPRVELFCFADSAVTALRRQGLDVHLDNVTVVAGFASGRAVLAFHGPQDEGPGYVHIVTAGFDQRSVERMRDEILADVLAEKVAADRVYEVWQASTNRAHLYYSAISPDNRYFLLGGERVGSLNVRLGELTTGKVLHEFPVHDRAVFTPDGKQILTYGSSGGEEKPFLCLWDMETRQERRRFPGHTGPVESAAVSSDGRLAASSGGHQTVRIWNLSTGKELRKVDEPGSPYGGVLFRPGGHELLSWRGKTVRLLDGDSGRVLRTFDGHRGDVEGAFFLADGKGMASLSRGDDTLRIWELASGAEVRRFGLGGDLVRMQGLGVSPATRRFLTSHRDGTMRLRDLDSGKEICRVQLHDGKWEGNGTSLSADGRFALSSTFRHTTYLLRLPPVPKKGEQEQK